MKWTMVLVGVLVLSMCSSTKSADPTVGEEPTSATVADESATTTEPPTTTKLPTTTQLLGCPDLSGVWQGTKSVGGQMEQGTVLISQAGMTFTLSFSEGFECDPADACEFDGTVESLEDDEGAVGCVWMAGNSGVADSDGGTFESFFGFQPASVYDPDGSLDLPLPNLITGEDESFDDVYMGDGQSVYHHPPDPDMEWETSVVIYR